ncbi:MULTISPECIES: 2Fe-2S iron-sulfur cluster-binding protein [Haloarcula]|uniref:2Fe-2S iron-sulfur cluster-binding protein n=1 Tax=Haloarcula TaxID=2237 RepID=UPI0023E7F328|nr:2Fe-2S iron-sulfur cluster-binding protein [Halomicroarcula sp. SHR3]
MPEVEYLSYGVVADREWRLHEKSTFRKAAEADLDRADYGSVTVSDEESILDAAEREGLDWSLKCRKGRCGRCSAVIVDGEVDMDDGQEFLTRAEVEKKDICLLCVTEPETDVKLVYGVRELDSLENRVK